MRTLYWRRQEWTRGEPRKGSPGVAIVVIVLVLKGMPVEVRTSEGPRVYLARGLFKFT